MSPKSVSLALLSLFAASLLFGCGHAPSTDTTADANHPSANAGDPASDRVVGHWKGDGSLNSNPEIKEAAEAMTLEFKRDRSFSGSMGPSLEGTWTLAGNTLTLKLTKYGGSTIEELHRMAANLKDANTTDAWGNPLVMELSRDSKTLSVTRMPTGPPLQPIAFKRG